MNNYRKNISTNVSKKQFDNYKLKTLSHEKINY
jgi:hypothetical protein